MIIQGFKSYILLWAFVLFALGPAAAAESPIQIDFAGLQGAPLQNVEAAVVLPAGIVRDETVEERWLDRYLGRVPKLVADALEPFGYYRSETTVTKERSGDGSYRVLVRIDPGPQTIVRTLTVGVTGEGRREEELRRVVREFPLQKGASLDHQLYEQGKLDLRLEANALGYMQAAFSTHTIRVTPAEDAADIELVLETGPRFYFGETTLIDESESFDEDFLRRFLTYHPGDVYSHKELHRTRLSFYGANRFDDILIVPLMDEIADQRLPISIKLVPGKQQRLRPGIGYGTNTGARISLDYRNMQVAETPHAYFLDLSLAEKMQFFETRYAIPRPGNSDNNLIGTIGLRREDLSTYTTQMIYAEGEHTYGLGYGKTGALYLRYLREDSDVGNDNNIAQLLIPGLRYYQRSYDDLLNPKRGYQFRLEVRGSLDALVSDVTLGQVLAAGSFMMPLSRKLTLHTRVEAATTLKDDELSQVPPSMRFFVGGDNSVRGYAYKSRGPRNEFGDVTGGDSLLVGSIEAEYSLTEQWGLALFYDAGSAFNASHEIEIIQGTGIGVRRYTPIGPIKFDLAYRIDEKDNGVRLHFSVGFEI